jgi:hypothetical protein
VRVCWCQDMVGEVWGGAQGGQLVAGAVFGGLLVVERMNEGRRERGRCQRWWKREGKNAIRRPRVRRTVVRRERVVVVWVLLVVVDGI